MDFKIIVGEVFNQCGEDGLDGVGAFHGGMIEVAVAEGLHQVGHAGDDRFNAFCGEMEIPGMFVKS